MNVSYQGIGHFLLDDGPRDTNEIAATYEIVSTVTPSKISTEGVVFGISGRDRHRLHQAASMKFRLETGDIVDVVFFGGDLTTNKAKIVVNSVMPKPHSEGT